MRTRKTYANQITYTTYNDNLRCSIEHTTTLDRPYPLTVAGAARILGVNVVRVESPVYA